MKLGDTIEFNNYLIRRKSWDSNQPYSENSRRNWVEKEIKPHKGIIIGIRNLQNGYTYREYGIKVFIPTEYIKAYLVSYNLYRKPVLVKFKES